MSSATSGTGLYSSKKKSNKTDAIHCHQTNNYRIGNNIIAKRLSCLNNFIPLENLNDSLVSLSYNIAWGFI